MNLSLESFGITDSGTVLGHFTCLIADINKSQVSTSSQSLNIHKLLVIIEKMFNVTILTVNYYVEGIVYCSPQTTSVRDSMDVSCTNYLHVYDVCLCTSAGAQTQIVSLQKLNRMSTKVASTCVFVYVNFVCSCTTSDMCFLFNLITLVGLCFVCSTKAHYFMVTVQAFYCSYSSSHSFHFRPMCMTSVAAVTSTNFKNIQTRFSV